MSNPTAPALRDTDAPASSSAVEPRASAIHARWIALAAAALALSLAVGTLWT